MDFLKDLWEKLWPTAPIGVASPEAIEQANKTKMMSIVGLALLISFCGRDIQRKLKRIF